MTKSIREQLLSQIKSISAQYQLMFDHEKEIQYNKEWAQVEFTGDLNLDDGGLSSIKLQYYNQALDMLKAIISNKDKFVICDFETSGVAKEYFLCDIAALASNSDDQYQTYVYPLDCLHPKAISLHHLTPKFLRAKGKLFAQANKELLDFVGDRILIMWNPTFLYRGWQNSYVLSAFLSSGPEPKILDLFWLWADFFDLGSTKNTQLRLGLPGVQYSAIKDCYRIKELILEMIWLGGLDNESDYHLPIYDDSNKSEQLRYSKYITQYPIGDCCNRYM